MSLKLLVHKQVVLEKISGKGGWTYAQIPEVLPNKKNPFGWVKVRGFIDTVEISKYHLMPMGNGYLFLPVKSDIRKKIKKQVGDIVEIILYLDETPFVIPLELKQCLLDVPSAFEKFIQLSETTQERLMKAIYKHKSEEKRAQEIVKLIKSI